MINNNTSAKQPRTGRHNWVKGESGNPKGRPRKPEAEILRVALEDAKEKRGKHLIEHAIDLAYDNHDIMIAILKKILPDKLETMGLKEDKIIIIRSTKEVSPAIQTKDLSR